MIIRKLKQNQYEYFHKSLIQKAQANPLDSSYTVNMKINGMEYVVKIQPEKHYQIAILQALRIDRDEEGPNFELITSNNLLSSFLELLIYQGIPALS